MSTLLKLFAIYQGIKSIERYAQDHWITSSTRFVVFSDSQAALKDLTKPEENCCPSVECTWRPLETGFLFTGEAAQTAKRTQGERNALREVKNRGSEKASPLKEVQLGTYSRNAVSSRENRGTDSGHGGSRYCSWPLYIHHQTLCSEHYPDPTSNYEVGSPMSLRTSTYFVDFAPAFFICRCTRDTGEASEELLSKGVDRIGVGLSSASILPRLVAM